MRQPLKTGGDVYDQEVVVCWSPGRDSHGRIGINHLWKDLAIIIVREQTTVFVGRLFRPDAAVTGQRLTESLNLAVQTLQLPPLVLREGQGVVQRLRPSPPGQ